MHQRLGGRLAPVSFYLKVHIGTMKVFTEGVGTHRPAHRQASGAECPLVSLIHHRMYSARWNAA